MTINPDNAEDVIEMMDDLSRFLYERRGKMEIRQMAFLLIVKVADLVATYDLDNPDLLFKHGVEVGLELGTENKKRFM